jgi:hypothetical protein
VVLAAGDHRRTARSQYSMPKHIAGISKNGQASVEQKNGAIVRRLIGYPTSSGTGGSADVDLQPELQAVFRRGILTPLAG